MPTVLRAFWYLLQKLIDKRWVFSRTSLAEEMDISRVAKEMCDSSVAEERMYFPLVGEANFGRKPLIQVSLPLAFSAA